MHLTYYIYIYIYIYTCPCFAATDSSVLLLLPPNNASKVICACDRIGSYKFVGWCQSRNLLDVIFEDNREAEAALIDIEVSSVTSV